LKAPEVICATQHGFAADYWALGVIIYELMMGKRPYAGINRKEYKERLLSTLVQVSRDEKPNDWSEEARDIINNLLQRKEHMRLGHKGAQSVKDHPWFKDIDWDKLIQHKITPPFIPTSVFIFSF
jgi:serine/threonine protein kinase